MTRYALVRNARSRREADAYLPDNYRVIHDATPTVQVAAKADAAFTKAGPFVIAGEDVAGWTLDGYVIPRYASGLIWAEEIDLSHPIMKEVMNPLGSA